MATVKIPYLIAKPGRNGSVRWFWQPSAALRRAGWPMKRLAAGARPDKAEAEAIAEATRINERLAAWKAGDDAPGVAAPARVRPGTVAALIDRYKKDRRYLRRAAKTRTGYDYLLRALDARFGAWPVRAIDTSAMEKFYLIVQPQAPAKANAAIVMARILFNFAAALDRTLPEHVPAAENPAALVAVEGLEAKGRIWPREAVDTFVAAADRMGWHSVGTAAVLNEWIGQREGDVLNISRDVLQAGRIVLKQSKTGAVAVLPVDMVPRLVGRIEAEIARQRRRGVTSATHLLLNERTGQPWVEDTFRHAVSDIRKAALLDPHAGFAAEWADGGIVRFADLWFMHLRHTAVTRLAEAGCTIAEIASITRHSERSIELMLRRYLVRTRALAANAFQKRLDREGE